MTNPRIDRVARDIANRLDDHERRLRGVETQPQLANSSIENGSVDEYTADGTLATIIGKQPDGTHGAVVVTGPNPPAPSAPSGVPVQGAIIGRWDGRFAGEELSPMDFSHVSLHCTADPALVGTMMPSTLRATMGGELGDEFLIGQLPELPHYLWLVAWSHAGKPSAPSASISVTPLPWSSIFTSDIFQGKIFNGGTFNGVVFQTDTEADLGVRLDETGVKAYDSRPTIKDSLGTDVPNPLYKQRTFWLDSTSGNAYLNGAIEATYLVKDPYDPAGRAVTTRLAPDAMTYEGLSTGARMPGLSWSNLLGLTLPAIGSTGRGDLVMASGAEMQDAARSSIVMHNMNMDLNSSVIQLYGETVVQYSSNLRMSQGKIMFDDQHTSYGPGGVPTLYGANFIQSDYPVKISMWGSPVLQAMYAKNFESDGHTHLRTSSGMARLVGRNHGEGGNAWVSVLRDDHTGELAGLRRTSDNTKSGFNAIPIVNLPGTSGANMFISAAGWVYYTTSAAKYKMDIQPIPESYDDKLLSLEATTWYDKGELEEYAEYQTKVSNGEEGLELMNPAPLQRIPGMVAEQVLAAGLPEFVRFDSDGEVSGLLYERLGVALIPVVGRLRDRVAELESRLTAAGL